jgi:hypothetical protein
MDVNGKIILKLILKEQDTTESADYSYASVVSSFENRNEKSVSFSVCLYSTEVFTDLAVYYEGVSKFSGLSP